MFRFFFSTDKMMIYAKVEGPDVDDVQPYPRLEMLDTPNRERFTDGSLYYFRTPPPYRWFVTPHREQPGDVIRIRPYSVVYIEDPSISFDFTGLTIFMGVLDLEQYEGEIYVRFQAWRAARLDFITEHGRLLLMPSIVYVPLSSTKLKGIRTLNAFLPFNALRRIVRDRYSRAHASTSYRQPPLRNLVTRGSSPILLVRFEPDVEENSLGLVRHSQSSIPYSASLSSSEADSEAEARATLENYRTSADVIDMLEAVNLTLTVDWELGPARAETALGTIPADDTASQTEGTSATLCDVLDDDEDTLNSGTLELEVFELRWNGHVVDFSEDVSSADDVSDIVFETPPTPPVHTGPRYDVNGYLMEEDEDDMVIGSLLDD